jgi:hypothetical protein
VNYFAGWRGHPDDIDERRFMHPWLERLLDVQFLRIKDEDPAVWAFHNFVTTVETYAEVLVDPIADALRAALTSSATDDMLHHRIRNAVYDTIGFYFHTDNPGIRHFLKARIAEREGRAPARWMALLHPPPELLHRDVMNRDHHTWCHPCNAGRTSDASWSDLIERAVQRCRPCFESMERFWTYRRPEELRLLADTIGPENLNDGIVADPPCSRRFTEPLPLISMYQRIKRELDRRLDLEPEQRDGPG